MPANTPPRGSARHARGDDGVALVVSISLIGLVGTLMLVMLAYAIGETRSSGFDRQRASAVTASEGQLDVTLARIQNSQPALLPCGAQGAFASQQSTADVIDVDVTVTYFDAAGNEIDCAALPTAQVTEALVTSTGTSRALAGSRPAERRMETLVRLRPTFQEGLQQAIFGNVGVNLKGNGDVFGEGGQPNADVYTNGDFLCAQGSKQTYHGSIYAQGTATFQGTCHVLVDVHAADGVMSDSNNDKLTVGGRVLVSGGNATLYSADTVGQQVRASGTITWDGCSVSADKCVAGTVVPTPPSYSFPQISWNAETAPEWAAAGYTNVVEITDCTAGSDGNNAATKWFLENADSASRGKTVLVTPCRLALSRNAGTVELAEDLVIFADGGITFERSITIRSDDSSQQRRLYFIQPFDAVTQPCDIGITLDNRVTIESTVDDLLYTPCNVVKANNSDHYGQIYAGGTATIENKLTMFYKPLPVFGVPPFTEVVQYYELDTLYKREVQ